MTTTISVTTKRQVVLPKRFYQLTSAAVPSLTVDLDALFAQ
jgi:hypothetical protein